MGLPREFVVFDTETTGMPPSARLVEIGAIHVRGNNIVERWQSLVFPEQPIPPRVIEVHGITDEAVREAPVARDLLPRFFEWLGDLPLIAHNVSFDASMLAAECDRLGLPLPANATGCTLQAARALLQRRSHSLGQLAADLGLPQKRHHRAADDAETALHLYWHLLQNFGSSFKAGHLQFGAGLDRFQPRNPRLPVSRQVLAEAAQQGSAVDLRYHTARNGMIQARVSPRWFFRTRAGVVMEALCHHACHYKSYKIERIQAAHPCPDAPPVEVRRG